MRVLAHLAGLACAAAAHTAWVVESAEFAATLRSAVSTDWRIVDCGASGTGCQMAEDAQNVSVVIGRAGALELGLLPGLQLVQGSSYFQTDGGRVPPRAAIAEVTGFWPAEGADQIAEWVIAAIFESQYKLGAVSRAYSACAFTSDTPRACAADSTATNHTMVSELTVGVCGYGHIGSRVATRAAALGSTVVATSLSPVDPPPSPLKWLSSDNDRLFREADVVVVTVPGSGHAGTVGLINRTSLELMRPGALIIPVSAGPITFADLEAALRARPTLRAVVDVWPEGCWHYPNVSCGAPLGERNWPAPPSLAALPNVLPLPGMSMRDARFWQHSTAFVAANLDALAQGRSLAGVVRNASRRGVSEAPSSLQEARSPTAEW